MSLVSVKLLVNGMKGLNQEYTRKMGEESGNEKGPARSSWPCRASGIHYKREKKVDT
jgi:hypothetical protein